MHLEHKPSDANDLLISAINEADLGWKADVCKYQKHHEKYGDHCDDKKEKVTLAQVANTDDLDDLYNLEAQALDALKKPFGDPNDKEFGSALGLAQTYQKKYKDAQDIPDGEIPQNLDYRDINGYDFTSYFRDQGKCGSCYTISFT